jgi:signal transduction histidine kinase
MTLRLADTIQTRTVIVLLIGLGLFHMLSLWSYQAGLRSEIDLTNESRLAERLVSIKRAVLALPVAERDQIAHSLSGGPIEVHWSATELTTVGVPGDAGLAALRGRLTELAPDLTRDGLIVSAPRAADGSADPHQLQVSIKAPDGAGWVNFSVTRLTGPHGSMHGIVWSTTLMALGVVLVSLLMVRWLTRPLRMFAEAARQAYVGRDAAQVPVAGPAEVRELASAFNDMQSRIKRLIDERTQTLAAVSHDLKTPLTRLRLRAQALSDTAADPGIEADLDEMEAMLDASLMFLRGEQADEPMRDVDLSALLETLKDDAVDAGQDVTLETPRLRWRGRRLSLKRALTNLVWNAVRYGKRARISVSTDTDAIIILIDDDGPGLPEAELERVFAPFVRIETSRNRETGGVGLGLTIARSVLRGHGGDVVLHNLPERGLRAVVRLPLVAAPAP